MRWWVCCAETYTHSVPPHTTNGRSHAFTRHRLVSRADVARVMLGRNPDVYGADLEPRVSAGGISPAAAAALAAATAGAGGSGPTTSSGHAYGHGHGHMVAPLAATGSRLALGAAGSAAALSLGPPAPSGCLDSAEVARVARGTLYCSTQQHQLDLAAEAAHEAAAAAATAAAATAAEGNATATAGAAGATAGESGLFPAELLSSLGALGLGPDFAAAAAAETFEAAASSSSAAAALQLRQQVGWLGPLGRQRGVAGLGRYRRLGRER